MDLACARYAGPAHAARDHRRMAGHAAAAGDHAPGGVHAVDVLRRGLLADQDHRLGQGVQPLGLVGLEHDLARGRSRRGGQADGDQVPRRIGVDGGVQQLVEAGRLDARHGFVLADQPLGDQVAGDLQRRLGGALAGAGLQHVEPPPLDGELDVLHVAVVALQPLDHGLELGEHHRHGLLHRGGDLAHLLAGRAGERLGRADAGDHVLPLGVDQELAIEPALAGGRVSGEGDPRGRGLAHVAEHHGLDVDRRAPAFGDVVHAAVELGAIVHPAREHRSDGAPELGLRVLRERVAELALHRALVIGDHLLPVLGGEGGVDRDVQPVLVLVEDLLEQVVLQAEHHVRVHLDEAAVAVEGEAAVAGEACQALHRVVVQAEVQHRVHHARHGRPRPGADRDQERVLRIAEPLSRKRLDLGQAALDLRREVLRIGLAVGVIVDAGLRGDGEAGGHGQAQRAHLGEVGPLAAEQVLHRGVAVRAAPAEGIDPARQKTLLPNPKGVAPPPP